MKNVQVSTYMYMYTNTHEEIEQDSVVQLHKVHDASVIYLHAQRAYSGPGIPSTM